MAITFVGSAFGVDTATMPAHQAGDVIVVFAYADNSATIPTIGAGFSTINAPTGGNTNAHRLAYKVATSSAETVGTWTGASQLIVAVYRGVNASTPIGAAANLTAASDIQYPALTLAVTDGTSWVAAISGRRTGNNPEAVVPSGTVLRADTGMSGAGRIVAFDTNGGVASWPALNTGGTNTFRYRSISVELRAAAAAPAGITGALAKSLGAATASSIGNLPLKGAVLRAFGALTSTSAARLPIRAAGAGNLALLTATSTAKLVAKGSAALALGALTVVARSGSPGQASLAKTLGSLTSSAAGRSSRRAQLAASLGPLSALSSGAGSAVPGGRVSGQLAPLTTASQGKLQGKGAFGAILGALGVLSVARLAGRGAVARTLGLLGLAARGGSVVTINTPSERTARVDGENRVTRVF